MSRILKDNLQSKRKYLQILSDTELISRIHKELLKLNKNNPIQRWAKDLNRHFSKADLQMASRHVRRRVKSSAIRKTQIETTKREHFASKQMAIVKVPSVAEGRNPAHC